MPRTRIYVDTSVFGGVYDEEFAEPSRRFFDRVRSGDFVVLVSEQVTQELADAPSAVRSVFEGLPRGYMEEIAVTEEIRLLAHAYLDGGILGRASRGDAMHVASATVARADLIVSWNFRHLVQYDKIQRYNGVNALKGYRAIDIRSPLEVSYGNHEEKGL